MVIAVEIGTIGSATAVFVVVLVTSGTFVTLCPGVFSCTTAHGRPAIVAADTVVATVEARCSAVGQAGAVSIIVLVSTGAVFAMISLITGLASTDGRAARSITATVSAAGVIATGCIDNTIAALGMISRSASVTSITAPAGVTLASSQAGSVVAGAMSTARQAGTRTVRQARAVEVIVLVTAGTSFAMISQIAGFTGADRCAAAGVTSTVSAAGVLCASRVG